MDYDLMSSETLKKKLIQIEIDMQGAREDPTLDPKERSDLMVDLRSIRHDIREVLDYREEERRLQSEDEGEEQLAW
jgi:hypothetical protein